MLNVSHIAWLGRIVIDVHRSGIYVGRLTIYNLITDDGLDLLRDSLMNGDDATIGWLAWGDDATAPVASDSALGNEGGRKAITTRNVGGTGAVTTTTFLTTSDANQQIEEFGWFAGPSASAAPGSGVMVARVLYSRLKDNLESIQVSRTDTFGRV